MAEDQKKVVHWTSDAGRVQSVTMPMRVTLFSALTTLRMAHDFMVPFVKKLSRNTGDARISIIVEYVEKNREPEPQVLQGSEYERCFTPTKRPYPPQPFLPAPSDFVRHATDLPCPKCKAPANVACDDKAGETFVCKGNGLTVEDGVCCHEARFELLQRFAELTV